MSFNESLKEGLIGEGAITRWLIARGKSVLPAYQIEIPHGKGPRLFGNFGQLVCPDLLAFDGLRTTWIEAKTKSAFVWHRKSQTWRTGLDTKHWLDYVQVSSVTPFPVWILFLHRNGFLAKDTPEGMRSPCGLFGNSIKQLELTVEHQMTNEGGSKMVYWRESSLKFLAEYRELVP